MQADRVDRDEMWQMTESSGSCVVVVVVDSRDQGRHIGHDWATACKHM